MSFRINRVVRQPSGFEQLPLIFLVFVVSLGVSCSGQQRLEVRELPIERDGQRIALVRAETAITDEDRSRGLMFRKSLPDGDGMLFVFEDDRIMSFWMRNTYIPLSIAFISSEGRINEIRDMFPHDERAVISSRAGRYALEVPQNWFSRAGVMEGDFVVINF